MSSPSSSRATSNHYNHFLAQHDAAMACYGSRDTLLAPKLLLLLNSRVEQSLPAHHPDDAKLDRSLLPPLLSEKKWRRRRGEGYQQALSLVEQQEAPNWLPFGWRVERRRRTGGKTAGISDTFYYNRHGHQFRSKKEVLHYIETGERRRPKKKQTTTSAVHQESSGSSCIDVNYPPEELIGVSEEEEELNRTSVPGPWTRFCLSHVS